MDLNYARDTTSGEEGLALVAQLRDLDRTLPIVVMTAWGSVPLAVEAMRRGARDFILKPWKNSELVRTLRAQVEEGKLLRERLRRARAQERELGEALEIQRQLIPREIPRVAGLEIAGQWQPARVVGGDSYDVLRFNDAQAALCVADVSGKGLPAALLMSNLQAAVRATAAPSVAPAELCRRVNRILCENCEQDRYITFFYGLYNAEQRLLDYVNAGHNPPFLVGAEGGVERLTIGGTVLGGFPEARYPQGRLELRAGDRLVLFTDGITEAADAAGEEFGEERLAAMLGEFRARSAEARKSEILARVTRHCEGQFEDDATLIVAAVS
jgi:sigma-B regulation protein RsbU (phosphoserine phosphatase)